MTDASGLTPEQEAVRRLLAEARHDGATPPEVVSRLDETLASLVAERTSDRTSERSVAPVVDLGARRRRLAGIGLLAAAAVVVAGVAIGQGLPSRSGGEDAGTSAAGGQSDSSLAEAPEAGASSEDDAGGNGAAETSPGDLKSAAPLVGVPTVSSSDVDLDAELLGVRPDAAARSQQLGSTDSLSGCELPGLGKGRRLAAEVDGQPGVILFRRPDGTSQQAEVYVCGTPEPVRTLSLPLP